MPKLSLIVATISRVTELDRLFESLSAQTCADFDVIVADQNADQRLEPVIQRGIVAGLAVTHLRLGQPGLVCARNAGLVVAKGEYLAFPDDDCWYERDTLANVIARFECEDLPSIVAANWIEKFGPAQCERKLDMVRFARFSEIVPSSIMLFFSRNIFKSIGNFDSRFGLGGRFGAGEEVDLVLRALRAGASVVYFPQAVVHHEYGYRRSVDRNSLFRTTRSRAQGTGALYAKHRLENWVVIRGLLAPLAKAALKFLDPTAFWTELGTFIGRAEGYLEYRRSHD